MMDYIKDTLSGLAIASFLAVGMMYLMHFFGGA